MLAAPPWLMRKKYIEFLFLYAKYLWDILLTLRTIRLYSKQESFVNKKIDNYGILSLGFFDVNRQFPNISIFAYQTDNPLYLTAHLKQNKGGISMSESNRIQFSVDQVTTDYFSDNARKLNHLVDVLLRRYGGISQKDYVEYYSLAGIVFCDVIRVYNPDLGSNFDCFLKDCLNRKIMSLITSNNRMKRSNGTETLSLDSPIGDEDDMCLGDVIVDPNADVEKTVINGMEEHLEYGEKTENYLNHLSDLGVAIAKCIMKGLNQGDTISHLGITQKQYDRQLVEMKSFELSSFLI